VPVPRRPSRRSCVDLDVAIDFDFDLDLDLDVAIAIDFDFDLALSTRSTWLTPLRAKVEGRSGLLCGGLVLGGVQRGLRPSVLAVLAMLAAAAARGCALLRADGASRHAGLRLCASR
jgi:hypothetical protein